ncbi:DUF177 domain-containing protein [Helicobacter mustelae]|uniref:DUF177 domain-containing protein n=1 Tax=Helicobacter mustelae (strain ATCC 43772 / CCUG 25715 / CIP 103759 / LMG 18044 / NCTC 12198 / R85-136P) TaxID=679897 RepID=D3UHM5_HELM1|nr:hypothetical protein [Helicobacter mustelae]CBG39997.1 Putative hypothetical protein [Helicobacter mustelae 12198]SQH71509.1 Uncharacterised protein [Helicobacter mustelae]STP12634.1 Uncharacterised protein [Helicobacter mustelae]
MKISFRKITSQPKDYVFETLGMHLECEIFRKFENLFCLKGILSGVVKLQCARSGEEFLKPIEQELVLYIADGIWDVQSQSKLESFDVIEFFDGFIDIKAIISDEMELIKSDYHIKE